MSDAIDWRDRAACRGLDPAVFDSTAWVDHLDARIACVACPVVAECGDLLRRELAISRRGPQGTWAGVLVVKGRIVRDRSEWRRIHTPHRGARPVGVEVDPDAALTDLVAQARADGAA